MRRRATTVLAGGLTAAVAVLGLTPAAQAEEPTTGTLLMCASDSQGEPLPAFSGTYKRGSYTYYAGAIGDDGCRVTELPAGANIEAWVGKDGTTSARQSGTIQAGEDLRLDFYTSKVTVRYPGALAFGGPTGDWAHFKGAATTDGTKELFSNGAAVMFRADTGHGALRSIPVTWPSATGPGKSYDRTISVVRVATSEGEGVPGATVRYNDNGGNFWTHARGGAGTDANGLLGFAVNGLKDTLHHRVEKSRTVAIQDYDASADRVNAFETTSVKFHYNHLVRYNQAESGGTSNYWLNSSGMELFPGNYTFGFQARGEHGSVKTDVYPTMELELDGTPVEKTVATARLTDSKGAALTGGTLSVYKGGWYSGVAETDADGAAVWSYDGTPARVTFALVHEGAREQLPQQHLATDSLAHFRTRSVTLELRDHTGALFTEGQTGTASYYAGGWRSFGATEGATVTKELLPAKLSFRMNYEGSSQQVNNVALGTQDTVTFQTGLIEPAEGSSITSYYAGGWRSFYEGLELLPSKITFKVNGVNKVVTPTAGVVNTIS